MSSRRRHEDMLLMFIVNMMMATLHVHVTSHADARAPITIRAHYDMMIVYYASLRYHERDDEERCAGARCRVRAMVRARGVRDQYDENLRKIVVCLRTKIHYLRHR